MPVTAKLSKRFYDVLGEDIANELVEWFNAVDLAYRTDLRELNELNFARFDAKLELRLAELRSELLVEIRGGDQQVRTELQQLRTELRTGLQQVRVELLRWMFGFWVTTLIGIAGLLIALPPELDPRRAARDGRGPRLRNSPSYPPPQRLEPRIVLQLVQLRIHREERHRVRPLLVGPLLLLRLPGAGCPDDPGPRHARRVSGGSDPRGTRHRGSDDGGRAGGGGLTALEGR